MASSLQKEVQSFRKIEHWVHISIQEPCFAFATEPEPVLELERGGAVCRVEALTPMGRWVRAAFGLVERVGDMRIAEPRDMYPMQELEVHDNLVEALD
jgi:hypothetical protein